MNENNGASAHHSSNIRIQDSSGSADGEVRQNRSPSTRRDEQSLILTQSPIWSIVILWGLIGVIAASLVWACVAKIEEAIPALGKLEPTGAVKDVQAPISGVVKLIYVKDGQKVNQGARLLNLEPTAAIAQLSELQKIRTALLQENEFYRTQMSGIQPSGVLAQKLPPLPTELVALTKSRVALIAENQLYKAQLNGTPQGTNLTPSQLERLRFNLNELNSRYDAAKLEVEQLIKQLSQTQIKLVSTRDNLENNKTILHSYEQLGKVGAIPRLDYLKQKQEVRNGESEAAQLTQEQARITLAISEAKAKMQNTLDVSRKDLLTQTSENNKRIAEIDSQLTKAMVENNKRLAEVESQLSQTQLTLKYQSLTAPVAGTVFDMKAHSPGFVTNASETILKIVPDDTLVAQVFITNKDIGFVKEGMKVDVRINSFPFSEYGDIKGELTQIGSDVLPPDQIHNYYRFPAKVRLNRQSMVINGREIHLQSGMEVNANIKVRSRTVMSIFTDLFTNSVESLKTVR